MKAGKRIPPPSRPRGGQASSASGFRFRPAPGLVLAPSLPPSSSFLGRKWILVSGTFPLLVFCWRCPHGFRGSGWPRSLVSPRGALRLGPGGRAQEGLGATGACVPEATALGLEPERWSAWSGRGPPAPRRAPRQRAVPRGLCLRASARCPGGEQCSDSVRECADFGLLGLRPRSHPRGQGWGRASGGSALPAAATGQAVLGPCVSVTNYRKFGGLKQNLILLSRGSQRLRWWQVLGRAAIPHRLQGRSARAGAPRMACSLRTPLHAPGRSLIPGS